MSYFNEESINLGVEVDRVDMLTGKLLKRA